MNLRTAIFLVVIFFFARSAVHAANSSHIADQHACPQPRLSDESFDTSIFPLLTQKHPVIDTLEKFIDCLPESFFIGPKIPFGDPGQFRVWLRAPHQRDGATMSGADLIELLVVKKKYMPLGREIENSERSKVVDEIRAFNGL